MDALRAATTPLRLPIGIVVLIIVSTSSIVIVPVRVAVAIAVRVSHDVVSSVIVTVRLLLCLRSECRRQDNRDEDL